MKPPAPVPKPAHRPPYEPTAKDRLTVKVMVAGGLEQSAIAAVIGVSQPTLRKHFRHELDTAAAEANSAVVASLYQMATRGKNVAAAIWWSKVRMRWSERLIVEGEGDFGFSKLIEVLEERRQKPDGA